MTLLQKIENYKSDFEEESEFKMRFIDLINTNSKCFSRESLAGHITASAFIFDKIHQKILLIHHKKLNKWLQPGGHCDGDPNVFEVAKKEVWEETGLNSIISDGEIFDLDIHTIPERKGVPEHEHFDVRFLFFADSNIPLVQNHETFDLGWIDITLIRNFSEEKSILRMADKVINSEY
ncbi:MAG: NUDIX hydrolase [Cytophagaceae bacterium]|nr:NUDIX hydrolase [Cytophagaceae bacterium]